MWAASWLLIFGVALVGDSVRVPDRFWWGMLSFLCLLFVPPLCDAALVAWPVDGSGRLLGWGVQDAPDRA